jgi:hypothetical protein
MVMALDPAPVGMEVYNAHYSRPHRVFPDANPLYTDMWDELLTAGMRLWGFADDDSHDPADFGCTMTMACVEDPTPAALMRSLMAGRFYGSTGLLMEDVSENGGEIRVRLAAEAKGRFVGPGGRVLAESEGLQFVYRATTEEYVRFEAAGTAGRPVGHVSAGCAAHGLIFLQPFYRE